MAGDPVILNVDPVLMMRPNLRFFMPGTTACTAKNAPLDVRVEKTVEECLVHILDMRHHSADAGVVDENVDLAEFGLGLRHGGFHLADRAIVGLEAERLDAVALQFDRRLIEIRLLESVIATLAPRPPSTRACDRPSPVLPPVIKTA
jgi:hypothetical protein